MSELFKRTHMCGELRLEDEGQQVVLNGWVAKQRSLGALVFVDLRDKTGITQITFNENCSPEVLDKARSLRSEYVIGVKGTVRERSSRNPNLDTGDIEVFAEDLVIYSEADTPPIYIKDDDNVDENLRLKYRYLDLRKHKMQRNLTFRHKVTKCARDYFDENGFTEVETPDLIKPTPEGARDYLVPSRVNPGSFYALPQSPQMFKQLLMVGGTDRYFQIAKCFRDEDLRADRQPEFTQIDLEMSFVDTDDVIQIQEGFLKKLMKEVKGMDIETPFPRITYKEAMERFGSDKPDTRFGFELKDIKDLVAGSEFPVFQKVVEEGGDIRAICITGGSSVYSRKKVDKLTEECKHYGAKGLVWIRKEEDGFKSSVSKFFDDEKLAEIADRMKAQNGDIIFIASDRPKVVFATLGFLRRRIAGQMGLLDDNVFNFLWVVDFPMFEEDDEGNIKAMHHPFTQPKLDQLHKLDEGDILGLDADAYDIVLNGVELGGGSIRIHDRKLQKKMFDTLGLSDQECEEKFGFLIEAFKYGAPPHAGLAYGLDRMVMLLLGESSIREVIAFPKNQNAQCLVCEAPGKADGAQLNELGLQLSKVDD
ncbi:MAG: aspartate--tRNA ligase [Baileyella intestinalis]|uniref:aspartate--tRNA ligase n=1 Tax=Baileyella intestinalis TaxID=2606709 RepID=UPI0023F51660|nr:aspartate--tRNA ligase [Baileyella intestinalis]MCI7686311.1 aspartate--tRNA ligase [Clostridiales bacterium]MDD5875227.1 aspartate--tRNA ligase [Baileyella intestinalis]MDY2995508.1 aspartate--tRNA ligase [Baileyella intestinalis]